jgi:hypothetical protein
MCVCIRIDKMEFERLISEVSCIYTELHGVLLNICGVFICFLKSLSVCTF